MVVSCEGYGEGKKIKKKNVSVIAGQNYTQNATYNTAVDVLNAVINVVGDTAVAPSVLSSRLATQRAQLQSL